VFAVIESPFVIEIAALSCIKSEAGTIICGKPLAYNVFDIAIVSQITLEVQVLVSVPKEEELI
jgi:hypothetical protein